MTHVLTLLLLFAVACTCVVARDIALVTFDNAPTTTHSFTQLNDPVMGGKSTGTWSVDAKNKVGVFDGDVVDVPSLKAPGFIKAQAANSKFPDISSCNAIVLKARSTTNYGGYRLSFSNKKSFFCSFFSGGFKTHFAAPTGSDFQNVVLPFSNFSDCNSDSTGEPKKLCKDDKSVCPDQKTLNDIETVSIWAEGVAGKVHLEIESISATGCKAVEAEVETEAVPVKSLLRGFVQLTAPKAPRIGKNTCPGTLQAHLRYNMSNRDGDGLPFPLAKDETLAEAICCDSGFAPYAEPRSYYARPDVDFFAAVKAAYAKNGNKPITFYDSLCGQPLFNVPVNRTLQDFLDETTEHGWPSFRPAELVAGSLKILDNNYVVSSCGTHLGSNVPDEKGIRYCLDLSCVSGSPVNSLAIM